MISPELRFEGFDSRSWTNLLSLFSPDLIRRLESAPASSDAPRATANEGGVRPAGTLVIIHDADHTVLKAFHTIRGRVVGLHYDGPESLSEVRKSYSATRAIAIREGVLEEVAEKVAMRLTRGDDYVTQWLIVLRVMREMIDAGLIHIDPRPLAQVPIPTAGTVRRALDLVIPDERSLLVVLFQGTTPWTAVALRRRAGLIDVVAGPDLIARWTGPLGGDYRRDYRVVTDAIGRALAPVHLGIFADWHTLERLLRAKGPGAWAKAVAVRDLIIHPTPPYVAVAIAADATRAIAKRSSSVLGGVDALAALAPITQFVRGRISEIASVTATLGFNPLRALSLSLRRDESAASEERSPAPRPSSQDTSSQDTSSQDTSSQDTPSQDTSSQDTPSQDTPSQDTSSPDTSSQEASSQDTSSPAPRR